MDSTTAHLYNTKLVDRTLWFDGTSSFDPKYILRALEKYSNVKHVDYLDETIEQYNRHASKEQRIVVKDKCDPFDFQWVIPDEYKNLNVIRYLGDKHSELFAGIDADEMEQREIRLSQELILYKKNNLFDVLRTIIFIINTLSSNNVVWGVGRGSSVSSYVLYVIGIHDVDSYAYDLPIDDFIHD